MKLNSMQPTIRISAVIKIDYQLIVRVNVPWGFSLSINLPITIGTIPFQQRPSEESNIYTHGNNLTPSPGNSKVITG